MAIVKKSNRVLTLDDSQLKGYLQQGYDQIDEKGKVIKRATGGKNVSVAQYNKLLDQLENQEPVEGVSQEDYDEVKQKAEEFAEKGKQLQEENNKLKKQLNKNK